MRMQNRSFAAKVLLTLADVKCSLGLKFTIVNISWETYSPNRSVRSRMLPEP
jgi:hypothetical protein